MKIRTRLLILVGVLGMIFAVALALHSIVENGIIRTLMQARIDDGRAQFEKIVALKGEGLRAFAYDYTYWDDMVSFVKTADPKWARENIEESMKTYGTDIAWVFDPARALVHTGVAEGRPGLAGFQLDRRFVECAFREKFCHAFVATPHGVLELRSATIHPSADFERVTPPAGVYIVGRLWDEAYRAELAAITDAAIEIRPLEGKMLPPSSEIATGTARVSVALPACEGAPPVAYLRVTMHFPTIVFISETRKIDYLITAGFFVGIFCLIAFAAIAFIATPLRKISAALRNGNVGALGSIVAAKTEFGDVARLIEHFFKQKEALVREIVERKTAQERYRESEEKFRGILQHATDGIVLIDIATKKFVFANWAFCTMFGYAESEIAGFGLADILPEERVAFVLKAFDDFAKQARYLYPYVPVRRVDRTFFFADISGTPVAIGDKTYLIGIFRDITERRDAMMRLEHAYKELKNTQDRLIQSEKMAAIGQLSVGLAHEIKNPLMITMMGIEAVERVLQKTGGAGAEYIRMIKNATDRANRVVRELLVFARTSKLELAPIDIHEALDKALLLVEPRARMKDVRIRRRFAAAPIMVEGDKILLEQVFVDLMTNAVDAVDPGGKIGLRTFVGPGAAGGFEAAVKIIDNGEGIRQEDLSRIFEPFFTTKEEGEGTGLGLSIAYLIVKGHNGVISVRSKPYFGTVFTVTVPALVDLR